MFRHQGQSGTAGGYAGLQHRLSVDEVIVILWKNILILFNTDLILLFLIKPIIFDDAN
jgi:hypothetical protein